MARHSSYFCFSDNYYFITYMDGHQLETLFKYSPFRFAVSARRISHGAKELGGFHSVITNLLSKPHSLTYHIRSVCRSRLTI